MVVSAILLTALAPITGALFGASYGTAIRIGYEIIFPALFADLINDQKNNPSKNSEDGAKRTIKALHTMFSATGGASALEFGIEQGIEMAKKKTESPAVQNMIALNLGLTDEQLKQRGRFNQGTQEQQDLAKEQSDLEESQKDFPDFESHPNHDEFWHKQIAKNYPNTNAGNRKLWNVMNVDNGVFNKANTKQRAEFSYLYKKRKKANPSLFKSFDKPDIQGAIDKDAPLGSDVNKIASLFALVQAFINALKSGSSQFNISKFQAVVSDYNRLVQSLGKAHLSIDVAKSFNQKKIVPKN